MIQGRKRLLLLAALVPLVGAKQDPLAGRVAGKPRQCINSTIFNRGPVIVDRNTIYYDDGRTRWVTGPRGECPSLRPYSTLITEVWGGQLCRNDRFRVKDPGISIPSNACLFREFTPYTKVPKAR